MSYFCCLVKFYVLSKYDVKPCIIFITHLEDMKAWLNDLAHPCASTLVSYSKFKWHREQFCTPKSLRNYKSIVITKPDKGSGGHHFG